MLLQDGFLARKAGGKTFFLKFKEAEMKESILAKKTVLLLAVFISLSLFANGSEAAKTKVKLIVTIANLREIPDFYSPRLTVVLLGCVLETEGKEGSWYNV